VSSQDKLQWEARWSRPAAAAAFAAGFLLLGGTVLFQSILKDRPRVQALPDFLLSVNDSPGALIGAAALQALSALCLIGVFYYLFQAIIHRDGQIPRWFVYLVFAGPAFYAISQVLGAIDRIDVAEQFAEGQPIFGNAGDKRAEDLLRDDPNPVAIALSLAGSVAVAFMFVMLPLRARRVGLLSPFMSILGVITGALLVLQLVPLVPVIIEAFWLGALGALFLGNWPGGRGPAWETGEPLPWPAPAQRRGRLGGAAGGRAGRGAADEPSGRNGSGELGDPADPAEPGDPADAEAVPTRPSSRKKKRKRG
jgi:hypothetical protein